MCCSQEQSHLFFSVSFSSPITTCDFYKKLVVMCCSQIAVTSLFSVSFSSQISYILVFSLGSSGVCVCVIVCLGRKHCTAKYRKRNTTDRPLNVKNIVLIPCFSTIKPAVMPPIPLPNPNVILEWCLELCHALLQGCLHYHKLLLCSTSSQM